MQNIQVELMKHNAVGETNPLPEVKEGTCSPGPLCATKVTGVFKYYYACVVLAIITHKKDVMAYFGSSGYTVQGTLPGDAQRLEFEVETKTYQTLLQKGDESKVLGMF